MEQLWLGYDNLSLRYTEISAVLYYTPALDSRIRAAFGRIPRNIRAVVLTVDGAFWPSSRDVAQLRHQLANWRETEQES